MAILFYAGFAATYHPKMATAPSEQTMALLKSTDLFKNEQIKFTETLLGNRQEPVNYIFLSRNNDHLIAALQQAGWILTDKADIFSFIKAVKALILKIPHPNAPISPSFWNAKTQDIGFAKVSGSNWLSNARHVKIWETNYVLKNKNKIYVGLVNANMGFKWGLVPKLSPDLDAEREILYMDLNEAGKIEHSMKEPLVTPQTGKNFIGDPFFTDGKIYIISVR